MAGKMHAGFYTAFNSRVVELDSLTRGLLNFSTGYGEDRDAVRIDFSSVNSRQGYCSRFVKVFGNTALY